LEVVRPEETILERWERLKVTGSRLLRGCTVEGKIKPIERHVAANGGGVQLIGVDAGEAHRMPDRVRPLVDLDITMQINRYDGQLPASLKLRNQLSLN
jgi:hypothetical protein